MAYQNVFQRYELKYLLSTEQKRELLECMDKYIALDAYGRSTVRSVYFDTPDHRLIRRSVEKPMYKEKLRARSYSRVSGGDCVFLELKKKYDGVVYKRRIALPYHDVLEAVSSGSVAEKASGGSSLQICREIDYFIEFYGYLEPSAFISYEREAYYARDGGGLRVTFDENILFRQTDVTLSGEVYGRSVIDSEHSVMEIKCGGGMPLWLVRMLSEHGVYKTPFSKYGEAYKKYIFPEAGHMCTRGNGST